jgi:hypothetical protein
LLLPLIAALAARILERRRRVVAAVGLTGVAALATVIVVRHQPARRPDGNGFGAHTDVDAARPRSAVAGLRPDRRAVRAPLVPAGVAVVCGGGSDGAVAAGRGAIDCTPLGLALALLAVALGVAAVALYGGRYTAAGAAWRFFLLAVLGLLPLLWAAWAQAAGQGGAALPLVMLLATLLLLGGFPFHSGLRGLARWSPPGALVLVLGPVQIVVVALLFGLLNLAPAARAAAEFQTALRGGALLSALLAAFLIRRERSAVGMLSGALLLDAGALTLAVAGSWRGGAGCGSGSAHGPDAEPAADRPGPQLAGRAASGGRDGLRRALLLYGAAVAAGRAADAGFRRALGTTVAVGRGVALGGRAVRRGRWAWRRGRCGGSGAMKKT